MSQSPNPAKISKELLTIAEAVSNEKGVSKQVIIDAICAGLESAARRLYGAEWGVRVELNPKSGEYITYRYWDIVPDDEYLFPERQLTLEQSSQLNPELKVGDRFEEPLPSVEFGRIAAQAAKQVIFQKVRDAERQIIVNAYRAREGELMTGLVKRVTRDNLLIDLPNNVEAILPRSEMLPGEICRPGDRVRAYLSYVKSQPRGAQLFLSRTHPNMLIELFRVEVPEVGEGVIMIKAVAREPGVRAKIAVKSYDGRLDPIGACIGMRGARVQAVSNELAGERVDIILWDDNPAQLVINAMAPAEVTSIIVDEDNHVMDLAVSKEYLSQAIGRNGQNIRLASELTGWTLNVMSEEEFSEKTTSESEDLVSLLMQQLDLDRDVADMLVAAGFSSVEEVAYLPKEEFINLEILDEETIDELRHRASETLLKRELSDNRSEKTEIQPSEDLLTLEGMTDSLAHRLAKNKIVTREDLAEQSVDDLLEIGGLDRDLAAKLIMKAREHWFLGE